MELRNVITSKAAMEVLRGLAPKSNVIAAPWWKRNGLRGGLVFGCFWVCLRWFFGGFDGKEPT